MFSKIFKTKHFMQENLRVWLYLFEQGFEVKIGAHMWSWTLRCLLTPRLAPPPHKHPLRLASNYLYTLTQAEGTRLMARWARHWPSACWCWPRHFASGPAVVGEVLGVQQVSVPRSPLRTPPWHSPAHETPPSASSRVVNRAYVVQQRHLQYRSSYLSLWGCSIFTLHVGMREELSVNIITIIYSTQVWY